MSYAPDYAERDFFAADASLDARLAFIRRTYAHVFGAVLAFAGLVGVLINSPIAEPFAQFAFGNWWMVLVAFLVASWVAGKMASSGASPAVQYCGLGMYVVCEALIFTPLLYIVANSPWGGGTTLILQAGAVTLFIFGGLTAVVMLTKADFSFLRNILYLGGIAALALIFVGPWLGFSLGLWFVVGMIVLMCGFILYDTSNVLHHYHTSQHVAAALALFASLATLFWYVLQLMSILGDD